MGPVIRTTVGPPGHPEPAVEGWLEHWDASVERDLIERGVNFLRIRRWQGRDLGGIGVLGGRIKRVIVECDLPDASALGDLSNLDELFMYGGVETVPFHRLPNLRKLGAYGDRIDRADLSQARSLEELSIGGARIHDLSALRVPKGLRNLELAEFPLRSLAGIEAFPELVRLGLFQLPLASLEGVEAATQLETVGLTYTPKVASIGPLCGLPQLQKLVLHRTGKLGDVGRVGELSRLRHLQVAGQALNDASFLAPLEALRELFLEDIGTILSVSFLRRLRRLERLGLTGKTTVSDGDMSVLLELPLLREAVYIHRPHYRPARKLVDDLTASRRDAPS